MRQICGMTSPTQPIIPVIVTQAAVINVAIAMIIRRNLKGFTPSAVASSSPIERMLIFQRKKYSTAHPKMIGIETSETFS